MADPSVAVLRERIDALERELKELRARLEILERLTTPRVEHPLDRGAVREKAVYDWQGPR